MCVAYSLPFVSRILVWLAESPPSAAPDRWLPSRPVWCCRHFPAGGGFGSFLVLVTNSRINFWYPSLFNTNGHVELSASPALVPGGL